LTMYWLKRLFQTIYLKCYLERRPLVTLDILKSFSRDWKYPPN